MVRLSQRNPKIHRTVQQHPHTPSICPASSLPTPLPLFQTPFSQSPYNPHHTPCSRHPSLNRHTTHITPLVPDILLSIAIHIHPTISHSLVQTPFSQSPYIYASQYITLLVPDTLLSIAIHILPNISHSLFQTPFSQSLYICIPIYHTPCTRHPSLNRHTSHITPLVPDTLLSTAIPVMMSLGVLIFLLGVLDIAWGRFCRIQRRLSCSVYRRGRASRTEHFRRKRRSDCVRGKEEDAPCRPEGMDFIKIYFRTVLAVFIDRTEMETEEIGEGMHAWRLKFLLLSLDKVCEFGFPVSVCVTLCVCLSHTLNLHTHTLFLVVSVTVPLSVWLYVCVHPTPPTPPPTLLLSFCFSFITYLFW